MGCSSVTRHPGFYPKSHFKKTEPTKTESVKKTQELWERLNAYSDAEFDEVLESFRATLEGSSPISCTPSPKEEEGEETPPHNTTVKSTSSPKSKRSKRGSPKEDDFDQAIKEELARQEKEAVKSKESPPVKSLSPLKIKKAVIISAPTLTPTIEKTKSASSSSRQSYVSSSHFSTVLSERAQKKRFKEFLDRNPKIKENMIKSQLTFDGVYGIQLAERIARDLLGFFEGISTTELNSFERSIQTRIEYYLKDKDLKRFRKAIDEIPKDGTITAVNTKCWKSLMDKSLAFLEKTIKDSGSEINLGTKPVWIDNENRKLKLEVNYGGIREVSFESLAVLKRQEIQEKKDRLLGYFNEFSFTQRVIYKESEEEPTDRVRSLLEIYTICIDKTAETLDLLSKKYPFLNDKK